jgi:hypothetical protein
MDNLLLLISSLPLAFLLVFEWNLSFSVYFYLFILMWQNKWFLYIYILCRNCFSCLWLRSSVVYFLQKTCWIILLYLIICPKIHLHCQHIQYSLVEDVDFFSCLYHISFVLSLATSFEVLNSVRGRNMLKNHLAERTQW